MPTKRGVVAAGHPLTAEAGAQVLREGGNAVDAAICAVLTSFVTESQLTGFGAGGFMLVHEGGEDSLTDFFVAAGGADGVEREAELIPIPVYFDETPQIFNCGAASCGVPGNPRVWSTSTGASGRSRWRGSPEPGIELGRKGVRLTKAAGVLPRDPSPDPHLDARVRRALRARGQASWSRATPSATRRCRMPWSASRRRARSRSIAATSRSASATGSASGAGRSAWTTWRPTSRSSGGRWRPASAATTCSPTRRPPREGS